MATMSPGVDATALEKLKRIAPGLAHARRLETAPLPQEIAFKLTARCDLRCTHCYQWGEGGHHQQLSAIEQRNELDLGVIERVLDATAPVHSNVFLWGGEPLLYRRFAELCERLATHQRYVSICTNGTLIERRLDSLLALGERLEVSVSLDGFEAMHDALRGRGAYARTMAGLRALLDSQRYLGEISVNAVLSDALVEHLPAFVERIEEHGVGALYLSFPWFLSPAAADEMDRYVALRHPHLRCGSAPSWHGYRFALSDTPQLRAALRQIDARRGPLKVRYNPDLSDHDLATFLSGSTQAAQGKRACGAIHTRMDVFPDGSVVSCKFFPEFTMGSLQRQTLTDVWHGASFKHLRDTVQRCGLMPVCAKCNLLYTRGQ